MEKVWFGLFVFQEHVGGQFLGKNVHRLFVGVIEQEKVEVVVPGDESAVAYGSEKRSEGNLVRNFVLL